MSKTIPFPVDFGVANRVVGVISTQGLDDLNYRLERHEGDGSLTGTLEIGLALTDTDEPQSWAALNLNGGIHSVRVDAAAFAHIRVGTAQSGYTGVLHTYTRAASGVSGGGP